MQQKWVRILLWIAVITVCGMIFLFSAQSGQESADTSGRVVRWMIAILVKGYHAMTAAQQQDIFQTASLIVRKLAHFSEFALLGFLVLLLMRSYQLKGSALWAWFATTLYAMTDECHQMFSEGRGPSLADVGIDSLGAIAGICFACLLMWLFRRRNGATKGPAAEE